MPELNMPFGRLRIHPYLLEHSDFTGGWAPDQDPLTMPSQFLSDSLNLLPEAVSGSLYTRPGFSAAIASIVGSGNHWVQQFHHSGGDTDHQHIVAIITDGSATANNVQLWSIKLSTMETARIDTAGKTWANPTENHWSVQVQGTYYGGVRGENMYSWVPTTNTWDANASTKSTWKTWVDAVNDGVTTATQVSRNYSYLGTEHVVYSGKVYSPTRSIRFPLWKSSNDWYDIGERVSRKAVWATTSSYMKSFRCIKAHDPSAATTFPGTGATYKTYWSHVRLDDILDDDGNTTNDWNLVPTAAQTSVGTWHAERMFLRYDNSGQRDRVQFSAPMKFKHGQDIASLEWEPTDWAPGSDEDGDGGGWFSVSSGRGHPPVTALFDYGQYLLIFKDHKCWVLSGLSEDTFNLRALDDEVGCVAPYAVAEHHGIVYFLGQDGLYMTDGTQAEPVPGLDNVRSWFSKRIDSIFNQETIYNPTVWSWGPYVWISLADPSATDTYQTVVYHPESQSFWLTDLPVLSTEAHTYQGVQQLYFHTAEDDRLLVLDDTSRDDGDPISWLMQTAWWSFGTWRMRRRIRRTWVIVKGATQFLLSLFRDYNSDTAAGEVYRTVTTETPQHIEGRVIPDSHAIQLRLAGTGQVTVYGTAVDTEVRGIRYHTG